MFIPALGFPRFHPPRSPGRIGRGAAQLSARVQHTVNVCPGFYKELTSEQRRINNGLLARS
jgi:hypothetical protein